MHFSAFRSALLRLGGRLRDAWIAFAIAVVLFLGLEAAYRVSIAIRQKPLQSPPDSSLHPYARSPWYAEFQRARESRRNTFDPYRSFWPAPHASRYLNVDVRGRRVTPQVDSDTAGALRVVMLGGSTLWGYTARDSFTIPALVAARLSVAGIRNVRVENLAQPAFNSTQEANTLMIEVGHGRVPDLVVTVDGYNDVGIALYFREAGRTYTEERITKEIDLGRRGFWGEFVGLGRHSKLITRLQYALRIRSVPKRPAASVGEICRDAARYYASMVNSMRALGAANGFPVISFQQPMHGMPAKPASSWEKTLMPNGPTLQCADSMDALMLARGAASYTSLRHIFDGDTATRFLDESAHLTEDANRVVAARIADAIAPALRARASRMTTP